MAAPARIEELKKRYEENQRRFFAPLANEYRKAGDLEQAIALCRMHLAEAPNNISGQIVFAQALYDAGTLDESRTAFETAIGLDPENLIALRHLGDIARANRDLPTARQWYQRVLDADRRNEEVQALMEELDTLELSPPEAPPAESTNDGGSDQSGAPSDAMPASAMARSPMSSAASLTGSAPNLGSTTPTREIVGMARPKPAAPEPEPVAAPEAESISAPEPERVAASEPDAANDMGFGAAEPEPESRASQNPPDSSFGFHVDLDAAADIPSYADDSTSEFGVVELPAVSAFSDAESEPAPAQFEPIEMAYDAKVEATIEGAGEPTVESPVDSSADIPAEDQAAAATVEMPSVLEYVEAPSASSPPDEPPPNEELLDFELEAAAPPEPVPEPAFEAFELTADTESDVAAGPAAVEEEPAPARRASLESFDPIRHMPTPIAPMAASRSRTPFEPEPPVVEETTPEPPPPDVPTEVQAPQEAFATETMAELYVQQGLRQEAIGVYHQLIAARPDDAGLRARLAELTGATRKPGGSTARAFFANLAGRRATPLRTSAVVDAPVPRSLTPLAQPVVEPDVEPVVEPVAEVSVEPAAEPAVEPPPAEPTDASATGPAPESFADSAAQPASEPDSGVTTAPAADSEPASVSPGGTLDALFGHTGVATPDNSAAQALAAAFASSPTPPAGRPTRAASDEFSLDRVFRKESGTPGKGGLSVPRQSTSLRFDQFFTPPADAPGDAPSSNPPADTGGDSEQFQSWLSRLKKP